MPIDSGEAMAEAIVGTGPCRLRWRLYRKRWRWGRP